VLTLLEQLDKGTLWSSPGGIHPPQLKHLSNQQACARLPLADEFIVPIAQVGELATLTVKVGDKVLKGQTLTQGKGFIYLPVHAPTSGEIIAIETRASNHSSSLPVLSCVIKADGLDTWCELTPSSLNSLSNEDILAKIKQAGIAGMGGAAFPSHIKLNPASEIDLVIINGIECEPYITSDDRLMRDHSDDIVTGIEIIHTLLTPQRIIVAIEDNKPEAAAAMSGAIERANKDKRFPEHCLRVTQIPTKYPSGGEKQLIQIISGKEVPSGSFPAQLGIVVHNVGTAFAIQEAVLAGKPLVERLVTLTGERITRPGNYWLPIGTPLQHALTQAGFTPETEQTVIVGGPMMGYAISTLSVPILKGTNCLLAPSSKEIAPAAVEQACIRCGECAVACPALLLPQQLFWHAKAEEYDKAASFNLQDCIECGCCSYVCPSDIPLVEYYRVAKSALRIEAEEKLQAERAKHRFETRLQRLEDEKLARELKAKEAATRRQASMQGGEKNAVAEAMARIAAKKAAQNTPNDPPTAATASPDDKKSAVAAAVARAKAKKAAMAATADVTSTVSDASEPSAVDSTVDNKTVSPADTKKAAIAAAVARAKAKKAAMAAANANEMGQNESILTTDANADVQTNIHTDAINGATDNAVDDKKAKIAAAVARAKAKKLAAAARVQVELEDDQNKHDVNELTNGALNDKQNNVEPIDEATPLSPQEEKKAKIAAAVAKAKAKKLAEKAKQED
jgi:electron transport complex protein RnfC